jgi:hypothetical protein
MENEIPIILLVPIVGLLWGALLLVCVVIATIFHDEFRI